MKSRENPLVSLVVCRQQHRIPAGTYLAGSIVGFMRACFLKNPSAGFSWCSRRRDLKWLEQGQGRVAFPSKRSVAKQSALSVSGSFYFDMEESGLDTEGKVYANRKQMWEEEAGEDAAGNPKNAHKKQEWYHKGVSYWEGVEASVDGVLGGYGNVNDRDVMDSKSFLAEIFKECPPSSSSNLVALDCGAGVGRVTKNFLIHHFEEVDLVEPVRHFLEKAQADLGGRTEGNRAVNFFCVPLQDFTPEAGRYDVIWVQWCIGHLTDHDFIEFFKRAQAGLKPGGFFVLKENIAKNGFVVDKEDTSVTRSDAYFRDLLKQTGFYLYKTKLQKGFPKDLFAVRMYAVTPEPRIPTPAIVENKALPVRPKRRVNQPRKIL